MGAGLQLGLGGGIALAPSNKWWQATFRLLNGICTLPASLPSSELPAAAPPAPQVRSIGGGAEVWLGYQQSLRPCQVGAAGVVTD